MRRQVRDRGRAAPPGRVHELTFTRVAESLRLDDATVPFDPAPRQRALQLVDADGGGFGAAEVEGFQVRQGGEVLDARVIQPAADQRQFFDALEFGEILGEQVPQGWTSAPLDVAVNGSGFSVACSRRLVRGWFPLNPFAAEFGSNFDVVVSDSLPMSSEPRKAARSQRLSVKV